MAAGTKEDGGLIDIKVAFCRGPHTRACGTPSCIDDVSSVPLEQYSGSGIVGFCSDSLTKRQSKQYKGDIHDKNSTVSLHSFTKKC